MTKLFCYRKGSTPLHKIPALIKLLIMFFLCAAVFRGSSQDAQDKILSSAELVQIGVCLLISLSMFFLSGAHLSSLAQLRFVFVLGAFVTLIRVFSSFPDPKKEDLIFGASYTARFFISSLCAQTVFETTSSLQIKDAIELAQNAISKAFPPLKKLNPALVIALAINFIPSVFETWNKVSLAAKAREVRRKKRKTSIRGLICRFSALFSCLINQAETTRKAVLNRSPQE